ncbi:MAG: hypothetical protein QJR08_01925 [Bacillota bacterium]|nr:hypothetical protein [Bacillota bacterium]
MGEMLAALPDVAPPPGLEERIHLRLLEAAAAGGAAGRPGGGPERRRPRRWPLVAGLAAAAALALVVGAANGWLSRGAVQGPAAPVRSTASAGSTASGRAPGAEAPRTLSLPAAPGGAEAGARQVPAGGAAAAFDLRVPDPRGVAGQVAQRLAQLGRVSRKAILPGQTVAVEVEYAAPVPVDAVRSAVQAAADAGGGTVSDRTAGAHAATAAGAGQGSAGAPASSGSVESVTVYLESAGSGTGGGR